MENAILMNNFSWIGLNKCVDANIAVANNQNMQFTSTMENTQNDEQLMLQYAKGEVKAFEQLFAKHKGSVYRFCLRQLKNEAKAEECFQDIWVKLINSRSHYQPKAKFTTYLFRIAQNNIIDCIRKDKKYQNNLSLEEDAHIEISDPQATLEVSIDSTSKTQQLRQAIENLPIEQKTAMLLKVDAGMSLEDIAEVIGCKRETVKSRLRYAMNKLKAQLGED